MRGTCFLCNLSVSNPRFGVPTIMVPSGTGSSPIYIHIYTSPNFLLARQNTRVKRPLGTYTEKKDILLAKL